MTDKQIIDITKCPFYREGKICTYLPYESKCESDCNWISYKEMEEQLLRKEQECEELKREIAFGNNGTLSDKIRAEVFKELNNKNDRLKAKCEELEKQLNYLQKM